MENQKISFFFVLKRGLKGKCPRCGEGSLFEGWSLLRKDCPTCHLLFEENEGDSWGFMYFSTAFITGLLILFMLFWKPAHPWVGRVLVLISSLLIMLGTMPYRKGLAISIDYYFRSSQTD